MWRNKWKSWHWVEFMHQQQEAIIGCSILNKMLCLTKDEIIAFTPLDHTASEKLMQKADMFFSRKGIMKGVECMMYEYKL